ncbi:hypothetical protein J2T20_004642 [Paenibacillus wynnii]|nr:hypothetical protein [Paenibacillus wynnii]
MKNLVMSFTLEPQMLSMLDTGDILTNLLNDAPLIIPVMVRLAE